MQEQHQMSEEQYTEDTGTGMEIAIIGMAGRFPGAKNIQEFWDNLKQGKETITFFTEEELREAGVSDEEMNNPAYTYVKARGILEDVESFDESFFNYSPNEAVIMDPQMRIFHECAWEALENAGYDPWTCEGSIGFYAGATTNPLWMVNAFLFGQNAASSTLENALLNNKDYLSTRISYKLNLKGPVVSVHTACSTSLVAVHMGVQALLMGECDMALAGGITVLVPNKRGYPYSPGMINSPDGHTRAFDEKAQGFVAGNGAGLILLKRLEDAISSHDFIYSVILATAMNNDGVRRVGYTAPSVQGQAEVIRTALSVAEVDPRTIGYIETHGTATNLGDPIEIEALKQAFQQGGEDEIQKEPYCALGSVKTNIGHLDCASGIAGMIKAVLSLHHHLIPPSLYFETPNPHLGLEKTPFYVNTSLTEWERKTTPLRAGVSSFGIGGTNVHVVLEEAPGNSHQEIEETTPGNKDSYLLLLSARTKTALARMSQNLGEYLKAKSENPQGQDPSLELEDVAFTLQRGRKTFSYKRMVCCSDIPGAVDTLLTLGESKTDHHHSREEDRPVIFMFPGLGSQYVNMGRELYEKEPRFREEMDHCFELVKKLAGIEIKEILYPENIEASHSKTSSQSDNIHHIEPAQLGVFIFEYALTNLLLQYRIKPVSMIGYSFGEYMAACISGVFTLEDALKLVIHRGKLIKKIPAGAMLSVPLPEQELKSLLENEVSIAIDNGGACIVSGSHDAINRFEKKMKTKRIICVRLQATHGIHSAMMDTIEQEFEEAFSQIALNEPKIPYLSNVTGKWITIEDATNPRYWVRHLKETVRFADGLKELVKTENAALVEVGPGVVLSTLAVQQINRKSNQLVLNMVRAEAQKVSDREYFLSKMGKLWLNGKRIDWTGLYPEQGPKRVPLPTYPFEGGRYSCDLSHLNSLLKGEMPQAKSMILPGTNQRNLKAVPPGGETETDENENGYVAPRNKAEQLMAGIWEEILGFKPIGIHEDFFEMGADSLKGMGFVNKLQEFLGEIIHITVIFDAPTVAQLSEYFKKNYPQGYARMMDLETEAASEEEQYKEEVTREKVEHIRGLIYSQTYPVEVEEPKNSPAVFVLSPPRTGSTLLRVMLAGHPQLFAPPELNLMTHDTLKERKEALSGRSESHLQGTLRAIMQAKQCIVEEAEKIMEEFENSGMMVKQFYHQLQEWISGKKQLLVDKSPGYSLFPHAMERAELYFNEPRYIFLLRHPYGMIRSYIKARMDLLMGQQLMEKLSLSRQAVAEMTWIICVLNIIDFLEQIPEERQLRLRYEDLVAEPEKEAHRICDFLDLEYHPDMVQPYKEKEERMTDPVYNGGIMLGDMKFHQHKQIDRSTADTWKNDYTVDFWGQPTRETAKKFGYKSIQEYHKEVLVVKDKHVLLLRRTEGTDKNLFLLHDRSGDVEAYLEFSRRINPEFNIWGIRVESLKNYTPEDRTIEDISRNYLQQVKKIQPKGPYFIAGWSFGGTVAFEMVSQLEQINEKVLFCALIDTPEPNSQSDIEAPEITLENELQFVKHYFQGIGIEEKLKDITHIQEIWLIIIEHLQANEANLKKIEPLIQEYKRHIAPGASKVDICQLITYLNLGRTLFKARSTYVPSRKNHTRLHYFWANQSTGKIKEQWNQYCHKPAEFHEVTGDHFSIFKRPNVAEFGRLFSIALEKESGETK
jgi:acyl transferase domain-containing protein/thioesterase domain-containing protein